jgi:hypothetical protein
MVPFRISNIKRHSLLIVAHSPSSGLHDPDGKSVVFSLQRERIF